MLLMIMGITVILYGLLNIQSQNPADTTGQKLTDLYHGDPIVNVFNAPPRTSTCLIDNVPNSHTFT